MTRSAIIRWAAMQLGLTPARVRSIIEDLERSGAL
jgi:hypothetical protein